MNWGCLRCGGALRVEKAVSLSISWWGTGANARRLIGSVGCWGDEEAFVAYMLCAGCANDRLEAYPTRP
jgi:hypothetical protein